MALNGTGFAAVASRWASYVEGAVPMALTPSAGGAAVHSGGVRRGGVRRAGRAVVAVPPRVRGDVPPCWGRVRAVRGHVVVSMGGT